MRNWGGIPSVLFPFHPLSLTHIFLALNHVETSGIWILSVLDFRRFTRTLPRFQAFQVFESHSISLWNCKTNLSWIVWIILGDCRNFFANFGQIDIYYSISQLIHQMVHCNFCSSLLQMGNQKWKSSDIEKEFVVMNDGNGEDTDPESPPGFSLSEPAISGHRNQRNVARSSIDKGKSKMVATPGKLPVKRTRSVRARTLSNFSASPATPSEQHVVVQSTIAKAPAPTPVTKSAPPLSRPPQFQFTKAPKKKLATGARDDCSEEFTHLQWFISKLMGDKVCWMLKW